MLRINTLLILLFSCCYLQAQMWNGTDSIYGNEWINYDQSYFKVLVTEDGMHRLSKSALESAGLPINSINGSQLQVFYMGIEIPVYVSSEQIFGGNDYLEFFGQKNRGAFDRYLYQDADNEMLNPEYSLVNDTSAYFITWAANSTPTNRFSNEPNNLNNLPAAESFYMARSLVNFSDRSVQESFGQGDVYYSSFDGGEGYGKIFKQAHTFNLNASEVVTSADSKLILRMATSKSAHDINISFGGNTLANVTPSGYTLFVDTFNIATSSIEDNNEITIVGNSNDQDKTSIGNVWLIYPRAFNFNGENQFIFQVEASNNDKYFEINNFNADGQAPVLYDVTNGIRVETELQGSTVRFRLDNSSQERTLVLSSQATGYKNANATAVNFVDYTAEDGEFIIISHPKLYNDGNGNNFVAEYANYRSTAQGGDYNTLVVDVQQLYDQFGFGINRHFLAIRNFGHYIKSNWTNPQYVFIIGKGREYLNVRNANQLQGADNFAVPTFGSPGADNLLMASLDSNVPVLPIGRIAVDNPEDIKTYLDKIQLMESGGGAQTIEDQLWKKNLLHLGGGTNSTNEPIAIRNQLSRMEEIIENNKFGGNVTSFFKQSSDPIQIGDSDGIFDRINSGLSLITFFGHSAVGTFDFNIENPARYENYGKYPMLMSLGCYSGNIHTSARGISERFVFLKDKGVIAFGAATGQGYISSLGTFAQEYYSLLGEDLYGSGIGNILQQTITNLESNSSFTIATLIQQFTIHGDPSLKLYDKGGPDYVVESKNVSFDPNVLTATLDSIIVNFKLTNLGQAFNDSIVIELEQELPNGERRLLTNRKVATPAYEEQLSFTVPSFKKQAAGQNKLFIKVDINDDVEEFPNPAAEGNNSLLSSGGSEGLAFYIFDDSARPVYPKEFAIVNNPNVELKASTSDGLAPERTYIFEIDTTAFFNSSIVERTEITSTGGVLRWNPDLEFQDDMVYYWRVSPDSTSAEQSYVWENSSFVFRSYEESKGWNQSHYFQFDSNPQESITISEDREWEFPEKYTNFQLINKLYDPDNRPKGIMDNSEWSDFFRWDIYESLTIVVFSSKTYHNVYGPLYGTIWFNNNPGEYGSVNITRPQISSFPFPTSTLQDRENIINFVDDIVPEDAYVVVYTSLRDESYDLNLDEWVMDSIALNGVNLFNFFESKGATEIRNMEATGPVPYVFAFKKGGEVLYEQKAFDINGTVSFEISVPSFLSEGVFTTSKIGPATSWGEVIWEYDNQEIADTASITVIGINMEDGSKDSLITFDDPGEYDISSLVDINQYVEMELRVNISDIENQTPVDIKKLTVLYEGIPEIAVSSALGYNFYKDTIQQGDQGLFEIAIENVSDYDTDSLLLKYSLIDASNNEIVSTERLSSLEKSGGSLLASFPFETTNLRGLNNLILEANPDDDQPEQFHFNNFAIVPFFVEADAKNPLLDVTFDGLHILDGDIVSPKPDIHISLNDENPFLSLSDTGLFKIFIKYPGALVAENIPIESEWVEFIPDVPSDNKNTAAIKLRPEFFEDGIYELLVQAEDISGNQSGELDYKVTFEIVTKSSISNILNYPNPFSTSTQFVYTLTGDLLPEFFKIQIFTASGKIVREIGQDELGPLKVGTHRTDFRWDGTDEYGDRLANGVYLYRVVAKKSDGSGFESFDTSTDSMFKRGFGKMVIIR